LIDAGWTDRDRDRDKGATLGTVVDLHTSKDKGKGGGEISRVVGVGVGRQGRRAS